MNFLTQFNYGDSLQYFEIHINAMHTIHGAGTTVYLDSKQLMFQCFLLCI